MYLEMARNWDFIRWVDGLGLMTRAWSKPFLKPMGLPDQLCDNPELWNDLYWTARSQYNELDKAENYSLYTNPRNVSSKINLEVLKRAFEELALRTDVKTVELFCSWYNRHFEVEEISKIKNSWRWVLINGIWPSGQIIDKVVVPRCFELVKQDLATLVWHESEYFRIELSKMPVTFLLEINEPDNNYFREVIMSRTNKDGVIEDPKDEDIFGDASIMLDVIEVEATLKAIRIINSSPDRQQLMDYLYTVADLRNNSLRLSDQDILDMCELEKA
jgi:hypothetical protein